MNPDDDGHGLDHGETDWIDELDIAPGFIEHTDRTANTYLDELDL